MGTPSTARAASTALAKQAMRAALLHGRTGKPAATDGAELLGRLRQLPEYAAAATVAAYVAVGTEPPTAPLLDDLLERGIVVLLPVLEPDGGLDWAGYDGRTRRGAHGLREPTGAVRGRDALRAADLVVVPALAIDRSGTRLGRGGGSFDRALARRGEQALIVALVYDDEYVDTLPSCPYDVAVGAVVTARHTVRFRR